MNTKKYLIAIIATLSLFSDCTAQKSTPKNMITLVTYFSCTGITRATARSLAKDLNADLFEIKPQVQYTKVDLNWNDKQSRSSVEMADQSVRPALAANIENLDQYDVIFIGFPIWWYVSPRIINTFIEANHWEGKIVVPFATSGGSDIKKAEESLHSLYPQIKWGEGKLLNHRLSQEESQQWLDKIVKK